MVGRSYLPEIIARLGRQLTYHWMFDYREEFFEFGGSLQGDGLRLRLAIIFP